MNAVETPMQDNKVVSGKTSLEARNTHAASRENEFTRLRDELSRQRLDLPQLEVEKNDVFDGPRKKETIADLFDGLSQSIVYHLMLNPDREEGCPSASSCPIILTAPLFI